MPLYDYKCTKCSHIFEVQQRISEEPLKFCPLCKGEIKRLISAAGLVFKGSGFYSTDSKKSTKATVQSPKSKVEETKSEVASTKTETKEAKTETPAAKTEKKESKGKEVSK